MDNWHFRSIWVKLNSGLQLLKEEQPGFGFKLSYTCKVVKWFIFFKNIINS